jgi:hypothetical protein
VDNIGKNKEGLGTSSSGSKKSYKSSGQGLVEELWQGKLFVIGAPGQEQKFITRKRAVVEYFE